MTDENPEDSNRNNSDKNYCTGFPKCPECGARSRPENGELICSSCPVVVQDNYLDNSRNRHTRTNANNNDLKARSVTTRTRHDHGLGSSIAPAYDTPQNAAHRDLEHLQRWWSTKSQDRSLKFGNNEIKRVTEALNLSETVREEASRLFHIATVEKNCLRGRNIELAVAGSVHAAACLHGVPRTASEVANEAICDKNEVYMGRKLVSGQTSLPLPDAVDYLPRFTQALHDETTLNYQHIQTLQSMAHHLIDKTFNQKPNTSARVLAASALYAASRVEEVSITQSDVTTATGVDEATISRHYKTFLNTGS